MAHTDAREGSAAESPKRPYEPPKLVLMNEEEVLKAFQITSAGVTWWG